MATFQENLENIKNAVYGREVRQALYDAIEYSFNTANNASSAAQEDASNALNVANGIASTAQSASSIATQAENKATQAENNMDE